MGVQAKGGRVAIVTGGGSGIGRAAALALLGDGWCVRIDDKLIESLRDWLSPESVEVIYS